LGHPIRKRMRGRFRSPRPMKTDACIQFTSAHWRWPEVNLGTRVGWP
jgi:hypothetical protein